MHEVTREELQSICDEPPCDGYAEWKVNIDGYLCDIYLMPYEEYGNNDYYNITLGHETRHCKEGNWH